MCLGVPCLPSGPGGEQGADDDGAAGEDADGPPERGVVAVCQRQPGQRLAAGDPGGREIRGEIRADRASEQDVQQPGADRGTELLADGDSGEGDADVLRGHAEGASTDRRRGHGTRSDCGQDHRAQHARGIPGVRAQLGQPDRSGGGLGQDAGVGADARSLA